MHPSITWAGVSFARLLEHAAGAIATLNPALIVLLILLLVTITVAINLTIKNFVNQTPEAQKSIIKLVNALRRRPPKS
jgi:hypothetical protein